MDGTMVPDMGRNEDVIALGRKPWLFTGSARVNDGDPQAWLVDVLRRIAQTPQTRLDALLLGN